MGVRINNLLLKVTIWVSFISWVKWKTYTFGCDCFAAVNEKCGSQVVQIDSCASPRHCSRFTSLITNDKTANILFCIKVKTLDIFPDVSLIDLLFPHLSHHNFFDLVSIHIHATEFVLTWLYNFFEKVGILIHNTEILLICLNKFFDLVANHRVRFVEFVLTYF